MQHEQVRLSLRERNRQRVQQHIISAAFELFSTVGYEQTTMDAIAEKAEVSRGTLFNYYPGKEALLMPYAKELYTKRIRTAALAFLETEPTTISALRFLLTNIYEHILTLPGMVRALRREFAQPYADKQNDDGGIGFFTNIVAILHYGQKRQEVRSDLTLEQLAHYVGILCASLFYELSLENAHLFYKSRIDTLLMFIASALQPATDI